MPKPWMYKLAWKYRRPIWKYRKQIWRTYQIAQFSKPILAGAALGAGVAILQQQLAHDGRPPHASAAP
ncbi:MAG: hypothetical protein M1541_21205 [Acidobacteria bacterium]|nr:hypothetical protein [Acidobacteriota bacterium]